MKGVIIKYSKKDSRLCRRFYLKWSDLFFELDSIDERCIENYKNLKKKEYKIDPYNINLNANECSYHHIKHYGVPGECPLCLLRTFLKEKKDIAYQLTLSEDFEK